MTSLQDCIQSTRISWVFSSLILRLLASRDSQAIATIPRILYILCQVELLYLSWIFGSRALSVRAQLPIFSSPKRLAMNFSRCGIIFYSGSNTVEAKVRVLINVWTGMSFQHCFSLISPNIPGTQFQSDSITEGKFGSWFHYVPLGHHMLPLNSPWLGGYASRTWNMTSSSRDHEFIWIGRNHESWEINFATFWNL